MCPGVVVTRRPHSTTVAEGGSGGFTVLDMKRARKGRKGTLIRLFIMWKNRVVSTEITRSPETSYCRIEGFEYRTSTSAAIPPCLKKCRQYFRTLLLVWGTT